MCVFGTRGRPEKAQIHNNGTERNREGDENPQKQKQKAAVGTISAEKISDR